MEAKQRPTVEAKRRPTVEAKAGKASRTRGASAEASKRKARGAKKGATGQGRTKRQSAVVSKESTGGYQAIAGGRMKSLPAGGAAAPDGQAASPSASQVAAQSAADEQASRSIGEIKREERSARMRESSKRHVFRLMIVLGVVVALIAGWGALYNSPAFSITSVDVEGVEHLTTEEMTQLANVPADTTLLRVDTETIKNRIMQNAWVQDVRINRLFPETLQIVVTERQVTAIVEMPNRSGSSVKSWAIAEDHMWLMPIPDANSEAAKTTSAKVYEDAERALHITDVPYGTQAEIGTVCTDGNVNNALDILAGMTTDLKDHVVQVSAGSTAETTLMLDSGVEIAFGKAENIRDKERVIMKILEENPDGVAYINVRIVETPTWRAI